MKNNLTTLIINENPAPATASTTPAISPALQQFILTYGIDVELVRVDEFPDQGRNVLVFKYGDKYRRADLSTEVYYTQLLKEKKTRIVIDTKCTPWRVVYPSPKTHPLQRLEIPELPDKLPEELI